MSLIQDLSSAFERLFRCGPAEPAENSKPADYFAILSEVLQNRELIPLTCDYEGDRITELFSKVAPDNTLTPISTFCSDASVVAMHTLSPAIQALDLTRWAHTWNSRLTQIKVGNRAYKAYQLEYQRELTQIAHEAHNVPTLRSQVLRMQQLNHLLLPSLFLHALQIEITSLSSLRVLDITYTRSDMAIFKDKELFATSVSALSQCTKLHTVKIRSSGFDHRLPLQSLIPALCKIKTLKRLFISDDFYFDDESETLFANLAKMNLKSIELHFENAGRLPSIGYVLEALKNRPTQVYCRFLKTQLSHQWQSAYRCNYSNFNIVYYEYSTRYWMERPTTSENANVEGQDIA